MKTVSLRLPDPLHANIEAEARARRMSKSDVMRERLQRIPNESEADPLASIRDLIGSVDDDLPEDLSAHTEHYLRLWKFGENRNSLTPAFSSLCFANVMFIVAGRQHKQLGFRPLGKHARPSWRKLFTYSMREGRQHFASFFDAVRFNPLSIFPPIRNRC